MEHILELIVRRGIRTGEKLPTEKELSDTFGVGRSSVREAVRQLENRGVLEVRQGRGTFYRGVSVDTVLTGQSNLYPFLDLERDELKDMMDVREVLEADMVRRVVRHADEEEIGELQRLLELHERQKHSPTAFEVDFEFHMLLARSSGNSVLPKMLEMVRTMFTKYSPVVSSTVDLPDYPDKVVEQHRQVLQAIKRRDEQQAVDAMLHHLKTSRGAVLANFDILAAKRRLNLGPGWYKTKGGSAEL